MNERILFVDDDPPVRTAFARSLRLDGMDVDVAEGADKARSLAAEAPYAVIATDYRMPDVDGLQLIGDLRPLQPYATYMLVSGECDLELAIEAVNEHAVGYVITKPWDVHELASLLRRGIEGYWERLTQAAVQRNIVTATRSLDEQKRRIEAVVIKSEAMMAEGLLNALGLRHHETRAHCRRVAEYTRVLAEASGLAGSELVTIGNGALLHDIGKIGVPDRILLKPGPLDEEEWAVMRQHSLMGAQLLDGLEPLAGAREIVLQHHERFDGTGYPGGLAGERICRGARLFAVADALDAILSERPYKPALSIEEAMTRILAGAGSQFDPKVVQRFAQIAPATWLRVRHAFPDR